MLKTRRSCDRLIFNMGTPYMERRSLYWDRAQVVQSYPCTGIGRLCMLFHTDTLRCSKSRGLNKLGPNQTLQRKPFWRHQMETFSASLAICAGNSPASGDFPAQRPVTRSFDVFFGLCLNKRLRKQSWGWWFETLSRPLWRHCNDIPIVNVDMP